MLSRILFTFSFFANASASLYAAQATSAVAPKLAVVISVDQLRADYLVRFGPYFGEGGFKRLLEGGANFQNSHYRHAVTQTAPGHATILSGAHPEVRIGGIRPATSDGISEGCILVRPLEAGRHSSLR